MLIAPVIVYKKNYTQNKKEEKEEEKMSVTVSYTSHVQLNLFTNIASRIFFLMSSIFCLRSVSEKPFTCNIRICLTIVDLPDSPAPSKSNRCVAL